MSAAQTFQELARGYLADGNVAKAVAPLRTARRLAPDDENVASTLARALYVLGEQQRRADAPARAAELFAEAVQADPAHADSWNGRGLSLMAMGAVADAADCYRTAAELQPDNATVRSNLGNALVCLNDDGGAAAAYRAALALAPDDADIRTNHALHLLRCGDLAAGWPAYEWRQQRTTRRVPLDGPRWDGGPLAAGALAVWSEQGLGDELMFASCVPDLLARIDRVVLECGPKLHGLFARAFPNAQVVARHAGADYGQPAAQRFPWTDDFGPIAAWTGIGSLPGHLRPTMDAFAGSGGYLRPDPRRHAEADAWLAGLDGMKVGVCWQSAKRDSTRNLVYADLAALAPVLSLPGLAVVSLQRDTGTGEDSAVAIAARQGFTLHQMPGLDVYDDLEGLAGLIAGLDLVISVGTSVGELAGALGVRTWRLAPQSDWTALGTGRRPWFSSVEVFDRPDALLDWSGPVAAMRARMVALSSAA